MGKVRIGFAGVGFMGQVAHLRNYLRNADCEIVAVAEPRRDLAKKVAERYGIPKIYENHLQLAEDPDVDAVVASQPHLLNGHIAIPLLRSGKSVFVEKPIAGSYEEAADMVEAAHAGGAKLMVGFMKRYDSGVNAAKERLDGFRRSGALGAAALINAYCFGGDWIRGVEPPLETAEPVPSNPDFRPRNPAWMSPARQQAFNLYMNIFAHNINLVRYLHPGPVTARAALLREPLPGEERWQQATLLESQGVPIALYGAGVASDWWEERTEFYFDKGWVRVITPSPLVQQDSARVEVWRGDLHEAARVQGEPYWAFRAQADHFVACVRDNREPRSSGEDSLEEMRIMEDVFRKGEWV